MKLTVEFEVEKDGPHHVLVDGESWLNSNLEGCLPALWKAWLEENPAPKEVFERGGYLIAERTPGYWTVYRATDRDRAEKGLPGLVGDSNSDVVYERIAQYADKPKMRKYIAGLVVLAEFLEERGL